MRGQGQKARGAREKAKCAECILAPAEEALTFSLEEALSPVSRCKMAPIRSVLAAVSCAVAPAFSPLGTARVPRLSALHASPATGTGPGLDFVEGTCVPAPRSLRRAIAPRTPRLPRWL